MRFYLSSYKVGNRAEELRRWIAGRSNRICLIPNSRDAYPESERKAAGIRADADELAGLGFEVSTLSLKDYFGNAGGLANDLKSYRAFYVIGGNTFVLRQAMYLSGFDKYLRSIEKSPDYLYAGYSAGICVLAKDLHGLDVCDAPDINPYGIDTIWKGLGYFDFIFLPHYKSDHKETKLVDDSVEYCVRNNIRYKTLRDGDVVLWDNMNNNDEAVKPDKV